MIASDGPGIVSHFARNAGSACTLRSGLSGCNKTQNFLRYAGCKPAAYAAPSDQKLRKSGETTAPAATRHRRSE